MVSLLLFFFLFFFFFLCLYCLWIRQDVESYSRADAIEVKARVLVDQLPALETQVKELEAKL